jgi:lysophospholipase L1-like esterase
MNRRLVIVLAGLVLAAFAPARALADNSRGVHYYVSLGDSLAEGFQPNGDGDHGYADQLYALMRVEDPTLRLVKLGCGGETTLSTVDPNLPWEGRGAAYHCNFPHGSQLAEAVSFLHAHTGFVRAVTIDIGGNDFLDFGEHAPDVIRANLTQIVDELGAAAGPNVPVVGMNYYDPFLPEAFRSGGLAGLQTEIATVVGLNDLLEAIYARAGDPVADVQDAFRLADSRLVDGVPIDVSLECAWTWFCDAGDIHPNTTGHAVIAQTFGAVLRLPYLDDVFTQPFIGLPQYSCPQGYGALILYQHPVTDPLWQYDKNDDAVICKRIH